MSKYNDIDKTKWKDYKNILTDSLWLFNKRDNSGIHSGKYHGNFIPQIPHQLFLRYTRKGDWVLDPFLGSGTSVIEAQKLERNIVGIELQKKVLEDFYERIKKENYNLDKEKCRFFCSDSQTINITKILEKLNIKKFQFIIMHPPYWNIIKFSQDNSDLSTKKTLTEFLESLEKVILNTTPHLEKNRYCSLIIGDKYENGQVIPLGFYCMNIFLKHGFLLKGIVVKNFGETKGKLNQQAIWRYRAITNDFYIFKHEYVMIFKKIK